MAKMHEYAYLFQAPSISYFKDPHRAPIMAQVRVQSLKTDTKGEIFALW